MIQSTDQELMSRIVERDPAGMSVLYDRHAPQCLAIAERVLADRAEAEDLLQQVFLRLWEESSRYDPARGSVTAWLFTMVRSRALDSLRRQGARGRANKGAKRELPKFAAPAARRSSTIVQAVDALPDEQRQMIELAYYEGLTQTEIAKRLQQPLGTVKSRLRLGMSKLRKVFERRQSVGGAGA